MKSTINEYKTSRQRTELIKTQTDLFFSLVDYRNNLYNSNDPKKINEFYNSFKNREQLIQWMNERPKGVAYIHEVEGIKDIIVVIPTADFNGKYARTCRDDIFKGLHIIFVESGEIPDPYFNYAHNVNVGVKKAMKYNPKWIIVSNDDMYKEDNITKLIDVLSRIDEHIVDVLFPKFSNDVAHNTKLAIFNLWGRLIIKIARFLPNKVLYSSNNKKVFELFFYLKFLSIEAEVSKKFSIIQFICPSRWDIDTFLTKKYEYKLTQDFAIFSSKYIRNIHFTLLDETFINGREDVYLSINLFKENRKCKDLDFRIGQIGGASLGKNSYQRSLRELADSIYLASEIGLVSKKL